jgi:hypothetical protein
MTRDAIATFADADTEELAAAAANPSASNSNLPNLPNFRGIRNGEKFTAGHYS